jgi:spermidine synthase
VTDDAWFVERQLDAVSYGLRIEELLHREQTPYQSLEVFRSPHHGRVLILDGCVMLTELDEFIYHELLAHTAAQTLDDPRQALVIGGGDGGTVGELLKYPQLEITQVEIDERVTRVCQEYFPALTKGLDDPRVTLAFEDGLAYLDRQDDASLDLVVIDSTDPVGPAEGLITSDFYGKVGRVLKDDGVLVAQSQSPFVHPEELETIVVNLSRVFPEVWLYWGVCPSYLGSLWTFVYASRTRRPLECDGPAPDAHRQLQARYYSAGVHRGAFALPPFLQARLPEGHPQRD